MTQQFRVKRLEIEKKTILLEIQSLKIMRDFSELEEKDKEEIHKTQNWVPAWL